MERVRVFVQHIAHAADQLVTVIVALALAAPEMCHLRIGCCPGPFSPAVRVVREPSAGARQHCCLPLLLHTVCSAVSRPLGQVSTSSFRIVKQLLGDVTSVKRM